MAVSLKVRMKERQIIVNRPTFLRLHATESLQKWSL